jgi:fructosamine-3-kinase
MGSFRKQRAAAPRGFFACEAAGLRWLADAGAARVVQVMAVDDHGLDLERVESASPTLEAAHAFGRDLARLHDAGAPAFGSPPSGWEGDGFFGPLDDPSSLIAGAHGTWGAHYADDRVAQVVDLLGAVLPQPARSDLERVRERLHAGTWDDDDAPARLHGDLWSGNLLWTPDGAGGVEAVLIDPAAHGGHRLTDLAMLELFGAPHLDAIFEAYDAAHPLRAGWRELLGLHQIYPVGMHAVLFGGGYLGQLGRLAARYARTAPGES